MSHYAEMKCQALVRNEKDLVASLEEFFGKGNVEVHAEAVSIGGYDSAARKTAHVVVRKDIIQAQKGGRAWNDLGYERQQDGTYKLHVDPVDFPTTSQQKVSMDYAERVANRQLKAKGYSVKRHLNQDGTIKLVATKYS